MPKIITAKRLAGDTEKAREYVKTHILFPSGLLGLIFMVAGAASLVYQFMIKTYSWQTFLETSGLLLVGGLLGWAQTRYHQYLLREHPGHFASRMKIFSRTGIKRSKREVLIPPLEHRGRSLVPLWYILGIGALFGASAVSSSLGQVDYTAAFLLPWAGFFWAKLFFWRGVLGESKK
ncbi:MAG: hypothetical protein HY581_09550 [Nitrospirae bacterium]|nr:hypothetical protein [Nitrospirota bacterium]